MAVVDELLQLYGIESKRAKLAEKEAHMAENSKIEWTDHTFNPWEAARRSDPVAITATLKRAMRASPAARP